MSGQPMDYPLPLLCQDHKFPAAGKKDIFCSFVGRNTHPIRTEILKIKQPGWHITDKVVKLPEFCNILSRSIFTLCPRGYGPTSFRIKEAMQYGSIPVYISDEFIEPHRVNFNNYAVRVEVSEIPNLPKILTEISGNGDHIKPIFEKYFTYEANKKIIDELVHSGSI